MLNSLSSRHSVATCLVTFHVSFSSHLHHSSIREHHGPNPCVMLLLINVLCQTVASFSRMPYIYNVHVDFCLAACTSWEPWSDWGECTQKCSGCGKQARERKCMSHANAYVIELLLLLFIKYAFKRTLLKYINSI